MSKTITLNKEEKEHLQYLKEWADLILHNLDGFADCIKREELCQKLEYEILKVSDKCLDSIADRIEQIIVENQR